MGKIRVLIVDDSSLMRKMIGRLLSADGEIEVVDYAQNGEIALRKIKEKSPDVVTLDVEMPVMNGLDLLARLKEEKAAVRVLMVSALTKAGSRIAIEALALGALDIVHKPSGSISVDIERSASEIIEKVKAIAHLSDRDVNIDPPAVHERKAPAKETAASPAPAPVPAHVKKKFPRVLAIGISTGGPRALRVMFPQFPKDFPLPVLLVQHIPDDFVQSFAESLGDICTLIVKKAEHGEELKAGAVYIAPGDRHLGVSEHGGRIFAVAEDAKLVSGHVPSADYLFDSIGKTLSGSAVGVLMTGMGSDGAKGLHRLHESGAFTIAQDRETSTVFGMPRVAIGLGAADKVLPLSAIVPEIVGYLAARPWENA
ncbi:MAG: chemotaxis response regulator protein-glutamate methylesterase [Spirochaetota bacterium]